MDDLTQKLLLALVAFLLGLLAEVIKRVFQRDRRRLSYSVVREPIISVTQDLPQLVRQKLPQQSQFNVTRFRIIGQNTGSTSLSGISLLAVASDQTEVLDYTVATNPPRGVKHALPSQPKSNEVECAGVELDPKQEILIDVYLKAEGPTNLVTYWSGGGGVEWISGGSPSALGIEEHLVAIIRNYILAEFVPALFMGVGYLVVAVVTGLGKDIESSYMSALTLGGVGIGSTIGALVRFYFYLRIVPHLVAVIREFTERRSRNTGGVKSDQAR